MKLMSSRHEALEAALLALQNTGVPLIGIKGGETILPNPGDDVGIYYFIPKLAFLLKINIPQAIDLFFSLIIFVSFLLGILGTWLLLKSKPVKTLSFLGLGVLSFIFYKLGDVYLMPACIATALTFLFLFLLERKKADFLTVSFASLAGLFIGFSHVIRTHSGTAMILFIFTGTFFTFKKWFQKALIIFSLALGIAAPILFFNSLFHERDRYLASHLPHYQEIENHHVFWHSLFLGLGYVWNGHGLGYFDESATKRVEAVSPQSKLGDPEYERIIRKEYFALIRKDPLHFINTLFAKAGITFFYILVFANLGLIAAFKYPKPLHLEAAFWIAIVFNSLYGILVIPTPYYLMGTIAFSALYGLWSLDYAWQKKAGGGI